MPPTPLNIADLFQIAGVATSAERLTGGHVNDSYRLISESSQGRTSYLLQRLNRAVFPSPEKVMENIERVTEHLRSRHEASGERDRVLVPDLIRARDGKTYVYDDAGDVWRMSCFVEGTQSTTSVDNADQAEQLGLAFGLFQARLSDWSGPRLHETIPGFHDTPRRIEALERAIVTDVRSRADRVRSEISLVRARSSEAAAFVRLGESGGVPERIAHNDAKIANVLFDAASGRAAWVIDLDTVTPGLSLNDFGDMVRSAACRAAEDERDLTRVEIDVTLFEAVTRGYLRGAGEFITPAEREHLVTAGWVIALEQGVRFLTDYLEGDRYYRVERPDHNLDRCRTQFRLVESIERNAERMRRVVERVAAAT